VHGLRRTYYFALKLFWTLSMELLGDVRHVESYLILFGETDNLDSR
jgi:hypothetical protein